ncbi:Homoserine dehydrogenase [Alicyclobacillus hesperidum URH17-3-68]|uniref:Homoserine dehydrogenase n=1 Tax=Alicyclobacillus hesperidum TaxID=89784 RepID=A0A1H2QB66_9BACL|nr:homoserine dehydrogenase [Alicyclobacillus hesperidum]EJY54664.1 Homoserine dehydrogenase [Alicyclobacillus hesperidum URH17-3-68]GLV12717.1 homoserine dehydrogenase [Alicyclobacillus hesperidum]SDW04401.1 homoserine dehydrogenase [Alicyclobacillus hesperidum]
MQIQIGLLGCGTVGAGVVSLVRRRADRVADMTGLRPVVKTILVRDTQKDRGVSFIDEQLTTSPEDILADDDIQIVVETIGGIEPAKTYILEALSRGKHVVTANKDLIALHGPEILQTAAANGVSVLFEAAVGGAIPLVGPLKENLTANEVTDLKGIINGTTNFILTQMTTRHIDFAEALQMAQDLGYAEADPSSDVDGLDAARKLVILASIAFHTEVHLSDVRVEGIRHITATDVRYADEAGYVIKLLAVGRDRDGELTLAVRPTLIPKNHPLAHVSDAYNALFVRGDAAGDLMFFGRGAGRMPTASAVVGDIIALVRNLKLGFVASSPNGSAGERKPVVEREDDVYKYYFRLTAADQPGVFAQVAHLFGEYRASMETVLQKRVEGDRAEIVIVTHDISSRLAREIAVHLSRSPQLAVEAVMPVEPVAE